MRLLYSRDIYEINRDELKKLMEQERARILEGNDEGLKRKVSSPCGEDLSDCLPRHCARGESHPIDCRYVAQVRFLKHKEWPERGYEWKGFNERSDAVIVSLISKGHLTKYKER